MKDVKIKVLEQGSIKVTSGVGYCVVGGGDAICFFIDVYPRAYIDSSMSSETDCPIAFISNDDVNEFTKIEFPEFPGWRFHASGGCAKTIAIALVRKGAETSTIND